jgi:hypothetical protein
VVALCADAGGLDVGPDGPPVGVGVGVGVGIVPQAARSTVVRSHARRFMPERLKVAAPDRSAEGQSYAAGGGDVIGGQTGPSSPSTTRCASRSRVRACSSGHGSCGQRSVSSSDSLAAAVEFVGRAPSDDPIGQLAAACWQSDSSLLREALWDRREEVLLRLVGLPERDPRGRDLDLSLLDELLGAARLSRRQLGIASGIGAQKLVRSPQRNAARLRSTEMTLLVRHLAQTTRLTPRELSLRLYGIGEIPTIAVP